MIIDVVRESGTGKVLNIISESWIEHDDPIRATAARINQHLRVSTNSMSCQKREAVEPGSEAAGMDNAQVPLRLDPVEPGCPMPPRRAPAIEAKRPIRVDDTPASRRQTRADMLTVHPLVIMPVGGGQRYDATTHRRWVGVVDGAHCVRTRATHWRMARLSAVSASCSGPRGRPRACQRRSTAKG